MGLYRQGRIWYGLYYVHGHRIRQALGPDKHQAQIQLGEKLKERNALKYGQFPTDILYSGFKEKYLAYSQGSKAVNSFKRDTAALKALESHLHIQKLSDITPEQLEHWKAWRKSEGKGNATINRDLKAVKAMLNKAMEWGYIRNNFWGKIKSLKETRGRLLFYTLKELSRLLEFCKTTRPELSSNEKPYDWVLICMLGARAGLRRSEIYWLSWKDIDMERGLISVTPKQAWNPKTYEQRHIPMAQEVKDHLKRTKRAAEWVLDPRPSLMVMTTYFRRIVANAALRGGLHTLRHTFASHLAQAGVDLYTIAKLLGHNNVKTTQIYAHLCPDTFQNAVKKLPKLAMAGLVAVVWLFNDIICPVVL